MNDDGPQLAASRRETDDVYRLLSDRRRRTLLAVIAARSGGGTATSLGELASDVDRFEQRQTSTTDRSRTDLVRTLHHVHLPMLDDAGIVAYDPDRKRVTFDSYDTDFPVDFE